jgi:hypothetical protein
MMGAHLALGGRRHSIACLLRTTSALGFDETPNSGGGCQSSTRVMITPAMAVGEVLRHVPALNADGGT